jgi:type II secretory pathway component GspD/PulD (secretin)
MNLLYVRTTVDAYQEVIRLVDAIDKQPIQVLVKTLFIEVDAEEFESLGAEFEMLAEDNIADTNIKNRIEWMLAKGKVLQFPAEIAPGKPDQPTGGSFTLKGIMDVEKFQLAVDFLQRLKSTRTLASPNVICMNNCTAQIAITKDLVYIEDYEVDRSDISGTSYGYPQYQQPTVPTTTQQQYPLSSEPVIIPVFAEGEDTGFTLDVAPSVGKDTRFITIALNPRIREQVDMRTFELVFPFTQQQQTTNGTPAADTTKTEPQKATVERPVVTERSISTKLTVADGSIVALGGLITQQQIAIRSKIPLLSDIPVIGPLFGRKTFGDKKTNLLIFVQCELITPTGARYTDAGRVDEAAPPPGTPRVELREDAPPVVRPEP